MHEETVRSMDTFLKCPHCGSPLVNWENEITCSKCGLVVSILDNYAFSYEGIRVLQNDGHYGSMVIDSSYNNYISRLQKSIFSSAFRKENELKWIVDKLCENFHLGPSMKLHSYRNALILLHRFQENKERFNLAAIAAYSVVSTTRFYNIGIAPQYKKVLSYLQGIGFRIRVKDIFNVIFKAKEIGLTQVKSDTRKIMNEIISMIINKNPKLRELEVSERIKFIKHLRMNSVRLFEELKSKHYHFRSKNPLICLASIIYAASKETASMLNIKNPITQKELSNYIGYAEYSVRETYEDLFGKEKNYQPISVS
ncbi:MAG: TFIIB-type zinc ribbon-containing protein [Thermoproteota archaeon]